MRAKFVKDFFVKINEDFKSQRPKFIAQGYEENIVDDYLKKFRKIKDKNYKQLTDNIEGIDIFGNDRKNVDKYKKFHDLEVVVDYVMGQVNLDGVSLGKNIESDVEPLFDNDIFSIYRGDTPHECINIKGDGQYSWCVAANMGNLFYSYRMKENMPTFYFVKVKDRIKKEFEYWDDKKFGGLYKDRYHFFVIQVESYVDNSKKDENYYVVTSSNNDGDISMSWNDIVKIDHRLNEFQNIFSPVPLSNEEKEDYELFKDGISDKEYCKLVYVKKQRYIDIFCMIDQYLSDKMWDCTPEAIKNYYIGLGLTLSEYQYIDIKGTKLEKRFIEISNRNFRELLKNKHLYEDNDVQLIGDTQFYVLSERNKKLYIKNDIFELTDNMDKFLQSRKVGTSLTSNNYEKINLHKAIKNINSNSYNKSIRYNLFSKLDENTKRTYIKNIHHPDLHILLQTSGTDNDKLIKYIENIFDNNIPEGYLCQIIQGSSNKAAKFREYYNIYGPGFIEGYHEYGRFNSYMVFTGYFEYPGVTKIVPDLNLLREMLKYIDIIPEILLWCFKKHANSPIDWNLLNQFASFFGKNIMNSINATHLYYFNWDSYGDDLKKILDIFGRNNIKKYCDSWQKTEGKSMELYFNKKGIDINDIKEL